MCRSSRTGHSLLKAGKLVEQVAILRDTKHFVKDYNGTSIAPGMLPVKENRCLHFPDFQVHSWEHRISVKFIVSVATFDPPQLSLLLYSVVFSCP